MGRPFVSSMTDEQMETAANKHDAYLAARRVGSIKALAAQHDITPLSMWRRLKDYKENKRGARSRSS